MLADVNVTVVRFACLSAASGFNGLAFFINTHGMFFFRHKARSIARFLIACSAVIAVAAAVFPVSEGRAQSSQGQISPEFRTPAILRGRVNFWIEVFTNYGEHQKVVHHRLFPQVVFGMLDFSEEAKRLDPVTLHRLMKNEEDKAVRLVKRALQRLGQGNPPSSAVERHIAKSMSIIRGGPKKYIDVLNNDWVRTQTGICEKAMLALKRSGRYLPFIERIFAEEGLPKELTRLPFIESTFNYQVVSSAGAAGLWQFMPATAKGFNMRVSRYVDERKDPIIASRAAAQYIKRAYNRLGRWDLAVTSYNHGVTGVLKKTKEAGTTDLPRIIESGAANPLGFASSNFWPELLAAVEIYSNPGKYFPNLAIDAPLRLTERRLPSSMTVQQIMKQTGLNRDALEAANYALSEAVWQGRAPVPAGYVLRVPDSYSARLEFASFHPAPKPAVAAVAQGYSTSSIYGGIRHTVRKGDTLLSIAKKYNTKVDALKKLNNIGSNVIKQGQVLVIEPPKKSTSTVKKAKAAPAAGSGGKKVYKVQKKDTLLSVAKKFNITVKEIKKANNLESTNIRLGQVLTLPQQKNQ